MFWKKFLNKFFRNLFKKKDHVKLGLYGPPNGGKCVTPDTNIVLFDGKVKPIKDIFDEAREKAGKFNHLNDFEETYLDCQELNLVVPSFDTQELKIIPKKISFVYAQKYQGKIYKIKTSSGREIKTTPNHPLITVSNEGVKKVLSSDLKVGNCIAVAQKVALASIRGSSFSETNYGFAIKDDNLWDEIISIESMPYDGYVYDLTIEGTHTFLISNGLIAHNSTLANKICVDWLGEEMSTVSHIAHETREINIKEQVNIKNKKGKELTFSLVDTPGIATQIDYEDFIKKGLKAQQAKKRAKEATKGVIDAIKWLDNMDSVVIVLDATKDPYSQVNITIIGNLQARDIPVLIVANKTDLKKANMDRIKSAFPQYGVIGISAKYGQNIEEFYENLFKLAK